MSYELDALLATTELLDVVAAEVPAAQVARLEQGLALILMTDQVFDSLHQPAGTPHPAFERFPGGFTLRLEAWSKAAPIAYVEWEPPSGTGPERAAVWSDGAVVLGPLRVDADDPRPSEGSPISQALRRLGASSTGAADEAAAVGLVRHRQFAG